MSIKATSEGYTDSHLEFKIYLLRRGLSQRKLARQLGVTVAYLNSVMRGRRSGKALRKRLITELGIPAELIEQRKESA